MVVDVWDLGRTGEKKRKTRLVNCYDNWLGPGLCWQGDREERRRAIEDVEWDSVLEGRCLILGDFNAHSPVWNPQANGRTNAKPLETLIDEEGLYINNRPGVPTRPKATPGISIIDLSLTTPAMGPLVAWSVDDDHTTGSDHELLVMEWAPMEEGGDPPSSEVTGWQIQALQADREALEEAKEFDPHAIATLLSTFYVTRVETQDINIPFPQLEARLPDLTLPIRFHAGELTFIQDNRGVSYGHTIQRNFEGSFGGASESVGGKYEPETDFTLLHTAQREGKEELGRESLAYADRCIVSCFVHTSATTKDTFLLVSILFVVVDDHELLPTHEFALSKEHLDQSWKTRSEIENAQSHEDCPSPRDQFNMLPSKKACFALGFEIWHDHQKIHKPAFSFQSDKECFLPPNVDLPSNAPADRRLEGSAKYEITTL